MEEEDDEEEQIADSESQMSLDDDISVQVNGVEHAK